MQLMLVDRRHFRKKILHSTNNSYHLLVLQTGSRCIMKPSHTQYFYPTGAEHFCSVVLKPPRTHFWPRWRPLLLLYRASSPSGLTFYFCNRSSTSSTSKHKAQVLICLSVPSSSIWNAFYIQDGERQRKNKAKRIVWGKEQLRTWMLPLSLSMNW